MESIGQHPSIVQLLGQDREDHVLIMELGNADLYKVVKKMKADKSSVSKYRSHNQIGA